MIDFCFPVILSKMASNISYKSALIGNMSKPALNPYAEEYIPLRPAHTFWEDCSFKDNVPNEYSYEWEKKQYDALQRLKKSPTFQRKFATFAENILCVREADTEKGCRIDLRATQYWDGEHRDLTGNKKKRIGFWFLYRQDEITYCCVYECDDLEDPRTGWFFQWEHDEECCGFSCDYYGCCYKYPCKKHK